ncbi:hypothetical protein TNCV_4700641 [Trichonephila clavipes]|nr:hypothetical protein TNCV_4700641 [Trichonephila clavipes]
MIQDYKPSSSVFPLSDHVFRATSHSFSLRSDPSPPCRCQVLLSISRVSFDLLPSAGSRSLQQSLAFLPHNSGPYFPHMCSLASGYREQMNGQPLRKGSLIYRPLNKMPFGDSFSLKFNRVALESNRKTVGNGPRNSEYRSSVEEDTRTGILLSKLLNCLNGKILKLDK